MTNIFLLYQLFFSWLVLLSFSLFSKKIFKIEQSQSFLIGVILISLILLLFYKFGFYHFSNHILLFASFIPFFFKNFRVGILENKKLYLEFFLIIFLIFLTSHQKFFTNEDEIYFWAIKYKYFVGLFEHTNYYKNIIPEPYKYTGYGNIPSLFQGFINSYNGYNEGGAIYANNIILISSIYFLFGNIKNIFKKILYILIIYLILNNLSFGIFTIYNDGIIFMIFSCIIYYIIEYFNLKKIDTIFILSLILIFFTQIHRLPTILIVLSLPLFILKTAKKINFFLITIVFLISIVLLYFNIKNISSYIEINYLNILFDGFYNNFLFFLKTVFLTKNYNSQFGVSFNELLNYLKVSKFHLPEFFIYNSIWYVLCIFFILINKKNILNFNKSLLLLFLIFSVIIFCNKILFHNVSYKVFGRYITFIIVPILIINLIYIQLRKDNLQKFILICLSLFLIMTTPKKTFNIFASKNLYINYNEWNYNFYKTRQRYKEYFKEINIFDQKKISNILVVYKIGDYVYKAHPSLYISALQLDLYPNETTSLKFNNFLDKQFNYNHYLKNKDIIIYFNLKKEDIDLIELKTTGFNSIKKRFYFYTN